MALDYRKRCTQKLVKETMIELLEEKPLHKIKVKELCEKAGINRATFYHNFEDIYSLYESLEDDFFENYKKIIAPQKMFSSNEEIEKGFVEQITYIAKNKRLFMIFYRSDRCALLLEKLMKKETEWMMSFDDYSKWEKDETIAFDSKEELFMMNIFLIHGTFGLLYNIFSSGKDIEPKEFVGHMLKFYYKKMLIK